MTVSFLIKSLDSFLLGKTDREFVLEELEKLEDRFLHMEKENIIAHEIIEQSMEVIDSLCAILNDYDEDMDDEIEREIFRLEEIELILRNSHSSDISQNIVKEKRIFPVNPPLYEKKEEVFSPFNSLLEEIKKCPFSKMNLIEFSGIMEKSFRDIQNMREFKFKDEKDREEFNFLIDEIIEIMYELFTSFKRNKNEEDFSLCIRELSELNGRYTELYEKIDSSLDKTDDVTELICMITEYTKDEDFITENYLFLEESLFEYMKDEIHEKDMRNILEKMKESVVKTKKEYEKTCIYPDEWTVEVAAGDRLLTEGINCYEESLNFIDKHLSGKDEIKLNEGLVGIYEANKKLVLNQHLTEYIKKLVSRMNEPYFFRKVI